MQIILLFLFLHYSWGDQSLSEKLGILNDDYQGNSADIIDLNQYNPYVSSGNPSFKNPSLGPMYNPYEGQSVNELNKYRQMGFDSVSQSSSQIGLGISNSGPSLQYNQPGLGSVGIGSIMDNSGHSLGMSGNAHIDLGPNHNLDIGGFRTNNNDMYGISGSLNIKF